ncbi:YbfB/YjiJ family MFS transporter [Kibdelosporangium lantanae]
MRVGQGAAALAASMGVGRFVYTPILPLMTAQAGLDASTAADLATANYVGYFLGALATTLAPALARSRSVHCGSLMLLVATLAGMPLTHSVPAWLVLRLLAGIASAVVFVIAANSLISHTGPLAAWGVGGVGAGIALSAALVLAVEPVADWQAAWWTAAALAAVFTVGAWNLVPPPEPDRRGGEHATGRWFAALATGYTLEGVGYIIAGTFLVAAINERTPGPVGGAAWVVVGLAAAPSPALWAWLSRRRNRPDLLLAAFVVQAVGIALPAIATGAAPAMVAAVLFGATFLGIAAMTLAAGAHLRFPRAVALLTAGYSVGQILGPLVATPLLRNGYQQPLLLAAGVVLVGAVAVGVLRIGFPHRLPATIRPVDRATVDNRAHRPT